MRKIGWLFLIWLLASCSAARENAPTPASVPVAAAPAQTIPPATPTNAAPTATNIVPSPTSAAPTPTTTSSAAPTATPAPAEILAAAWSYPIGLPDRPPGDGFFIRHGYTVENTWYNPGYWHTGEDWYALEGDTAGAPVYAAADGEVVYAGANYPGRVVIIRHAGDLFSMYGHLDPALAVREGQQVTRGQQLGTVLRRTDQTPNHLHFEIRSFLTTPDVNGDNPRYGFRCGPNCAPGPGYWPIAAPDLPSAQGWRNPTHVIASRAFPAQAAAALGEAVVATQPVSSNAELWAQIADDGTPQQAQGEIVLQPGERLALLGIRSGPEAPQATSAQAYRLWYRVRLPDGREGWVQAAVASGFETGSDGRASTVRFNLFPSSGS